MINQILTQLERKTIVIKLDNEGAFSGELDIELDGFYITFDLDLQAYFSLPEPTTLEHYYPGGDLEGADIDISDLIIYDSNGDDIVLDAWETKRISRLINENLEFN